MRSLAIRALAAGAMLGAALAAPAGAETLTLASWNVALPAGDKAATARSYARLKPIATRLSADVIALQGVDGTAIGQLFGSDRYAVEIGGAVPRATALLVRKTLTYVRRGDYQERDSETGETRGGTLIEITIGDKRLMVMSAATDVGCGRAVVTADGQLRDRCDRLDLAVRSTEGWIRGRPGGLSRPYLVLGTVAAVPPAPAPAPAAAADATDKSKTTAAATAGPASGKAAVAAPAPSAPAPAKAPPAKTSPKPAKLPDFILRAEAQRRKEEARARIDPGCTSTGPGAALEYIAVGATARDWVIPATFQQLFFPGDGAVTPPPGFDTGGTMVDQCPVLLSLDVR